jgi:regulatory protein
VPAPPLSLKARALQWLAQREHSRLELRRKLLRLARQRAADAAAAAGGAQDGDSQGGPDPQAEVDALLDWLHAHRYLSDARFVESRVNARSARHGNLRIRQELGQLGAVLDSDTAERLKVSEPARARAVWLRKYGSSPASSAPDRARQMRFLAGRGFSADAIRHAVRGVHGDADDDA